MASIAPELPLPSPHHVASKWRLPSSNAANEVLGEATPCTVRSNPCVQAELECLLLAVAGTADRAAFESLFHHFAPRIRAYLRRLGSSADQAEELAQETMVNVWRRAAQYDPARAAPSTWVFAIARNLRIDAFRRERRPELDPGDPALMPEPAPLPDSVIAGRQDGVLLRTALAKLPAEQRDLVLLSFLAEDSHAAMAARLGLPLGTVKSRLRLAFRRLRAALGDFDGVSA